jgi:peptidyl-prolyl cis-trans isomerase C
MSKRQLLVFLISIFIQLFLLTACSIASPVSTSEPFVVLASATIVYSPEPSQTPAPPTPTQVPLAAVVNGEAITMAEFEAELARYQASTVITGTILASDTNTIVLNELIDQTLFAQVAVENGFIVDETMLQSRIDRLQTQLGNSQALENWITTHGYTNDEFRHALQRSVGTAWMRDQIIGAVPETADEVHVMQILLPTAAEADEVYASLQSGADFQELASTYDPLTGGDLGWFPRGYLAEPAIDEAVFALQPGQYSQVVQTDIGYHILYVAERDPNHTLQPDARRSLQVDALRSWVNERREQSEIQILLP